VTHPYLDVDTPLGLAHRGGAREAPENSVRAFRHAVSLGYQYIETDVRATADGVPVVFHDESLDRVTDRVGRIRDLPWSQVRKAHIGNAERVHSLQEVLDHFPGIRFNVDIKEDNAVVPVLELMRRDDHLDRVCIASFSRNRLLAVREAFGDAVCTSMAPSEIAALVGRSRLGRAFVGSRFVLPRGPLCVQVPPRTTRVTVVTAALLDEAHSRGWPVHVWTIDSADQMHDLFDMGVDGIMTDRPSILASVLDQRKRPAHGA
jgi:glycerophosphoryl diester phosphodiesterase